MSNCDCEHCVKCQYCGHKADEHMCGDIECGICFKCQEEEWVECSELREEYRLMSNTKEVE